MFNDPPSELRKGRCLPDEHERQGIFDQSFRASYSRETIDIANCELDHRNPLVKPLK
jgi:hypothetical protein